MNRVWLRVWLTPGQICAKIRKICADLRRFRETLQNLTPLTMCSSSNCTVGHAGGSDSQLEEELAAISCLHVLGCDEDCLAHYNSNARFGVSLEDLAEHGEHNMSSTGLVLYHIDTHELHGLWRAERMTRGDQVSIVTALLQAE